MRFHASCAIKDKLILGPYKRQLVLPLFKDHNPIYCRDHLLELADSQEKAKMALKYLKEKKKQHARYRKITLKKKLASGGPKILNIKVEKSMTEPDALIDFIKKCELDYCTENMNITVDFSSCLSR